MGRPLRILHLEDDPNDVELVGATLEADGLDCDRQVTSTREEFVSVLEQGNLDLVLSDFSLPGFDGLSALAIARRRSGDLPFIIVSGTLGEEAAIESLRSGATDYVMKHRLTRLGPAVRRALNEAEERRKRGQSEETLANERQFLKTMLESLEVGILACDSNGVVTLFNRATRDIHGLPEGAINPDRWNEHYSLYEADGRTPLKKEAVPLFRALQGEHVRNVEMVILPRNGPPRTLLVGGHPIHDAQGR